MFAAIRDFIPQPILNKCSEFGGEKKLGWYVVAAVAAVGTLKVVTYIKKQNRRKKWNAVGKDVVVLHTIQRGTLTPSISPFVLKLETYLRMAKIPYEIDLTEPMGPKGKVPWITLNGESIADSQMIIERLGKHFGKNFSSDLSPEQLGVALAMRTMVEEHFAWCVEIWFVIADGGRTFWKCMNLPSVLAFYFTIMFPFFKRKIRKVTEAQGLGRHSNQELEDIGRQDVAALSSWLGNKPFFMGDKPTEVDCAIFGLVAQIVWNYPNSPYGMMLKTECTNLIDYCHRMKETCWPDWNECLDPPQASTSSGRK